MSFQYVPEDEAWADEVIIGESELDHEQQPSDPQQQLTGVPAFFPPWPVTSFGGSSDILQPAQEQFAPLLIADPAPSSDPLPIADGPMLMLPATALAPAADSPILQLQPLPVPSTQYALSPSQATAEFLTQEINTRDTWSRWFQFTTCNFPALDQTDLQQHLSVEVSGFPEMKINAKTIRADGKKQEICFKLTGLPPKGNYPLKRFGAEPKFTLRWSGQVVYETPLVIHARKEGKYAKLKKLPPPRSPPLTLDFGAPPLMLDFGNNALAQHSKVEQVEEREKAERFAREKAEAEQLERERAGKERRDREEAERQRIEAERQRAEAERHGAGAEGQLAAARSSEPVPPLTALSMPSLLSSHATTQATDRAALDMPVSASAHLEQQIEARDVTFEPSAPGFPDSPLVVSKLVLKKKPGLDRDAHWLPSQPVHGGQAKEVSPMQAGHGSAASQAQQRAPTLPLPLASAQRTTTTTPAQRPATPAERLYDEMTEAARPFASHILFSPDCSNGLRRDFEGHRPWNLSDLRHQLQQSIERMRQDEQWTTKPKMDVDSSSSPGAKLPQPVEDGDVLHARSSFAWFSSAEMDLACVQLLAESLQMKMRKLRSLDLEMARIGPVGIACLVPALQQLTELRCLNLAHNNLGSQGAMLLAKALRSTHSDAFGLPALDTLCVYKNDITNQGTCTRGAVALAQALRQRAVKHQTPELLVNGRIYAPVLLCKETIEFQSEFEEEDCVVFAELLKSNENLTDLDVYLDQMTLLGWNTLVVALQVKRKEPLDLRLCGPCTESIVRDVIASLPVLYNRFSMVSMCVQSLGLHELTLDGIHLSPEMATLLARAAAMGSGGQHLSELCVELDDSEAAAALAAAMLDHELPERFCIVDAAADLRISSDKLRNELDRQLRQYPNLTRKEAACVAVRGVMETKQLKKATTPQGLTCHETDATMTADSGFEGQHAVHLPLPAHTQGIVIARQQNRQRLEALREKLVLCVSFILERARPGNRPQVDCIQIFAAAMAASLVDELLDDLVGQLRVMDASVSMLQEAAHICECALWSKMLEDCALGVLTLSKLVKPLSRAPSFARTETKNKLQDLADMQSMLQTTHDILRRGFQCFANSPALNPLCASLRTPSLIHVNGALSVSHSEAAFTEVGSRDCDI